MEQSNARWEWFRYEVTNSRALICLPCDKSKCEEPKQCTGSVVLGICGCCSVCAKQKNESCGGVYGLYGTCDRGLRCVIRPPLNGGSITQYELTCFSMTTCMVEIFGILALTIYTAVCLLKLHLVHPSGIGALSLTVHENWDDDQLLGFEPCNENLVTGCNIIDGKCECDSVRTCNNPFEFASQETCQTALQKIEVDAWSEGLVWFADKDESHYGPSKRATRLSFKLANDGLAFNMTAISKGQQY
ncbi:cysteine-rich motor neuron 1 -like protein [Labeo rohita]|uniref:Cysteine-rich motor neuron 1-like protein n=1 Tax=Labeo rohita TaxID=84645 RepID=A0A498LTK4_LABRO|nr:cysteine-rich motor neuron 1 -like protein [Labeo rohita]